MLIMTKLNETYDPLSLIIYGYKTQTRRLFKPGEYIALEEGGIVVYSTSGRKKYYTGQVRSIVPKRTKPIAYYMFGFGFAHFAHEQEFYYELREDKPDEWEEYLITSGWIPLRIEITGLRLESLQDISEMDALAEGVGVRFHNHGDLHYDYNDDRYKPISARSSYKTLWTQLHGANSWLDNPKVWVIEFKLYGGGRDAD